MPVVRQLRAQLIFPAAILNHYARDHHSYQSLRLISLEWSCYGN